MFRNSIKTNFVSVFIASFLAFLIVILMMTYIRHLRIFYLPYIISFLTGMLLALFFKPRSTSFFHTASLAIAIFLGFLSQFLVFLLSGIGRERLLLHRADLTNPDSMGIFFAEFLIIWSMGAFVVIPGTFIYWIVIHWRAQKGILNIR